MSQESGRRKFLVAASLAGAALAAGAAAGCGEKGRQVYIDGAGRLVVTDKEVADSLRAIWRSQESKRDSLVEGGIAVVFDSSRTSNLTWQPPTRNVPHALTTLRSTQSTRVQDASSTETTPTGIKINSLCKCMPGE